MRITLLSLLFVSCLATSPARADLHITRDHGGYVEEYKAKYARIRDHKVLVDLPPHGKRGAVQNDIFLFAALDKDEGRKHSGRGAMTLRTDGIEGHERSFSPPVRTLPGQS